VAETSFRFYLIDWLVEGEVLVSHTVDEEEKQKVIDDIDY
jgi:hypothetical protein